ncbi:hypothetical protein MRX96_033367 [Rhipicephalus microplus]
MFPARQEVGPAAAAAFQYAAATCYPTSCSPPPAVRRLRNRRARRPGRRRRLDRGWRLPVTTTGPRFSSSSSHSRRVCTEATRWFPNRQPRARTPAWPRRTLAAARLRRDSCSRCPRPAPARSPYEWMMKPSYQVQPNPGKTRTKDKYRVVYSDHQRLELEKEFHYSRYITIRRKAELASMLGLSERQVKIWFQNRRAKDRKQAKKQEEMLHRELVKAEPVPTATLPPFSAAAAPTDGYS